MVNAKETDIEININFLILLLALNKLLINSYFIRTFFIKITTVNKVYFFLTHYEPA
jgi:hypothetical protein